MENPPVMLAEGGAAGFGGAVVRVEMPAIGADSTSAPMSGTRASAIAAVARGVKEGSPRTAPNVARLARSGGGAGGAKGGAAAGATGAAGAVEPFAAAGRTQSMTRR